MTGRKARLLDAIRYDPQTKSSETADHYQDRHLQEKRGAYENVNQRQDQVRTSEKEEPLRFGEGDLVLMENRRRWNGESSKLQLPFCGPYTITKAYKNHTYRVADPRQTLVQNEGSLKEYRVGIEAGQAPVTEEFRQRPNMKGAVKRTPRLTSPPLTVLPKPQVAFCPPEPTSPPPGG